MLKKLHISLIISNLVVIKYPSTVQLHAQHIIKFREIFRHIQGFL
jgi:hypothetical protein